MESNDRWVFLIYTLLLLGIIGGWIELYHLIFG